MDHTFQRKLISLSMAAVGAASIAWAVFMQYRTSQWVVEAAKVGVIIDVSPDSLQRDLRIGIALIFGSIALYSRKAAKAGFIALLGLFVSVELVSLGASTFDRTEPLIHVAVITTLLAWLVVLKGRNRLFLSLFACFYVFVEFVAWHLWTNRIKATAGVPKLSPSTFLNNNLYGAQALHVVVLLATAILVIWNAGLLCRGRGEIRSE